MRLKKIKYIWVFLFVVLLVFFVIMAIKGREIHENVCPTVKTSRVKTVVFEGESYDCINKECVRDGRVYEIYEQKGFFNDNTRVKAIEVNIIDSPREDMVIILSGIESSKRAYYAVIPNEGLTDGEAVMIEKKDYR